MNRRILFFLLLLAGANLKLAAQGTAFNYQGRLNVSGSPATAAYDFRFAVYDAVTNGNAVSISVTNSAIGVTNGLFSVTLDFGAGVFTGTNYWLDIAVRAVGVTPFTPLFPRQPILPVPYAIFATSASNLLGTLPVAQISGTLTSAQLAGTYSSTVNFANSANTFSGTFTGNGSSLSNLNASQLTTGTVADARLSTNVALLNASQTFGGNNQFNGANSFTNFGNSFSGSFFGNGLVGWITVGGQSQTAVRDTGYMLTNSGLVTVTLPLNSAVTNGDIVRVSGAGGGGWLVAENAGQIILGNFASYTNSTVPRPFASEPVTSTLYEDVAASADGTRIYFTGSSYSGVNISVDSGNTWTAVALTATPYSIACSASGKIVYAELNNLGIQKSTDGGATWAASGFTASTLTSIACSADGNKLFYTASFACSGDGTYQAKLAGGAITISTNGGSTFSSFGVTAPAAGTVSCLAVSSDCTRLLAGITNGLLYASSNQGKTWTSLAITSQGWTGAWMSPDGSKFAATANATGGVNGAIYFCNVSPQPNTVSTNSTICGSQGSAVELQYIGGGKFMPVSSSGLIWAN